MSLLFTAIAILRDWKTLRQRNREVLIDQAQQAGATHYQIYRNIHDASQVLIVAELPDDHALRELRQALSEHIGSLLEGSRSDERMWEPTGWTRYGDEGIEGANCLYDEQPSSRFLRVELVVRKNHA